MERLQSCGFINIQEDNSDMSFAYFTAVDEDGNDVELKTCSDGDEDIILYARLDGFSDWDFIDII